ncbi:MAG: TetR family transcriptional regulator, partial [Pseudomonadota bacterium]
MRTRETIVEAAIALLAINPGATMTQIATAARVGRATLHRHFSSREDLLHEVARYALREMETATALIDYEKLQGVPLLQAVLDAVIPLGDRYYFLAALGTEGPADVIAAYARQYAQLEEMVERLKS